MQWTVVVEKRAYRTLSRLEEADRQRIQGALDAMRATPFGGDLKHLSNDPRGQFRRRVGSWRIFFDVDPGRGRVDVTAIERRTSTTY